jgi:hypothetical protein
MSGPFAAEQSRGIGIVGFELIAYPIRPHRRMIAICAFLAFQRDRPRAGIRAFVTSGWMSTAMSLR